MPTPLRPFTPRPGSAPRPRPAAPTARKRAVPLIQRVRKILFEPNREWQVIADEFTSVGSIYARYVFPLAAVPAVCQIVGSALWGVTVPVIGKISVAPSTALRGGLASYVGQLVAVYVLALIIDVLAPTFGGKRNAVQSMKVAAYAATAAWVAGVFFLVPGGQWLTVLGAYSLYLLYAGLAPVMRVPRENATGYAVVTLASAIVLNLVIAAIATVFLPGPGR